MGPDHPKRCSSIGGPRETGFRAEIPKIWLKIRFVVFRVAGFRRFSEIFHRKDESKALIEPPRIGFRTHGRLTRTRVRACAPCTFEKLS